MTVLHPLMELLNFPTARNQYKETLVELTKVTKDQLDEAVWLIWAFAQRASADLKIDACIRCVYLVLVKS